MSAEQELPAGLKPYYDFRCMRQLPHIMRYSVPEHYSLPLSECNPGNTGVPLSLPYCNMFTAQNNTYGGRDRSATFSFSPGSSSMATSNTFCHDGSVLLGKDEERNKCLYATRYHIHDRNQQHKSITKNVIMEVLFPCCHGENLTGKDRMIAFFQSDLLLIILHLMVLAIGMIKSLVHPYEQFTNVHLLEAVVESVLTSTIILIRAFLGAQKNFDVKQCHLDVENMKPSTRFFVLKFFSTFQIMASFCLVLLTIVSFIVFYVYINLNWITLVNNFFILVSYMLSSVVSHSGHILLQQVSLDQHKIALFESEMLLGELYFAMTTVQRAQVKHRVECFLKGLKATPKFNIPNYISCSSKVNDGFIVNMESGV